MIAHRGASGYRPEHTRAAFRLAIQLGADALEPDLVATADGVLVVRHENDISGTTDVASRPEFAGRRTRKRIDGQNLTGWFTEDFTWAELSTLRATERIPAIRPGNTRYADEGILRFTDLLALLDAAERKVALIAEIKHASYFDSIGLPLDELFAAEISASGWGDDPRLTVEAFEPTVLGKLRERGIRAPLVFLIEHNGTPADQRGSRAMRYPEYLASAELARLASAVDGISVSKQFLLCPGAAGADLVERAHGVGLRVYCWTLRAENAFLSPQHRIGNAPEQFGDWQAEFRRLLASGVDGVFADQPDLAIAARQALPH